MIFFYYCLSLDLVMEFLLHKRNISIVFILFICGNFLLSCLLLLNLKLFHKTSTSNQSADELGKILQQMNLIKTFVMCTAVLIKVLLNFPRRDNSSLLLFNLSLCLQITLTSSFRLKEFQDVKSYLDENDKKLDGYECKKDLPFNSSQ